MNLMMQGADSARHGSPPKASLHGQQRYLEPGDALLHLCYAANADGQWQHVNDRLLEYTGLRQPDLLGNGWIGCLHPSDVMTVQGSWERSLAQLSRFEVVCRLRGRDGGFRWYLLRASPMTNALGAISGWVGRGTDVDIMKRRSRKAAVV